MKLHRSVSFPRSIGSARSAAWCVAWSVISMMLSAWLTSATADEAFDPSALTKEDQGQVYDEALHILGGNANVISKWVGTINVAIVGLTGTKAEQFALGTFGEISELTGLAVATIAHPHKDGKAYLDAVNQTQPFDMSACSRDNSSLCANFVVLFSDSATMRALTEAIPLRPVYQRSMAKSEEVLCFFAPYVGRRMQIEGGFVYVREDLDEDMIRTCLQEEIFQSFGLFGDFTGSTFFSFNNVVQPKNITGYDRVLMKSLYADDITPGTPVFRVVKRFIDNLGVDPFSKD